MTVRRVFVIWTNPLFHELVRLLLTHPDVEWVGATSDYTAAQIDISEIHPDTVVVEVAHDNLNLVMAIMKASQGNVRIISLSMTDNELRLYEQQQQVLAKVEDLLSVLLDSVVQN